jgi:hypothetical protein
MAGTIVANCPDKAREKLTVRCGVVPTVRYRNRKTDMRIAKIETEQALW